MRLFSAAGHRASSNDLITRQLAVVSEWSAVTGQRRWWRSSRSAGWRWCDACPLTDWLTDRQTAWLINAAHRTARLAPAPPPPPPRLGMCLSCNFVDVYEHRAVELSWVELLSIGRVSYIRISLCYFCFRWKTVSLVQASVQHLMHHFTVSLQQSKITLQNNCINNTSITLQTLSFYLWLKM